ncbi:hypothetical protein [Pedobacter ginsengisoli]|uniref:hypothetical protein n=1 Tax=Pedobacter ginsengisoli TaxID=363852 RepID=UPI00254E496D|nr:hypothetical protein [Pedobacter ginsengisoli]
MKKFTLLLKMCLFLFLCVVFMAFTPVFSFDEQVNYIQKLLSSHYDNTSGPLSVDRYELNVTNTGFCRYKRHFTTGKVEYFSFNLLKFKDLDYYGTDKSGDLFLRTKSDDVIVQTYNDKDEGDVDSMATYMVIPLKNMEPQDLSDLHEKLIKLSTQRFAQK